MIQRIQSLYFLLTIVMSVLFLSGNYFSIKDSSGNDIGLTLKGIYIASDGGDPALVHNTLPITAFAVLISLTSIIAILSFRNRKIQLRLALSVISLVCMLIITSLYCLWFVTQEFEASFIPDYKIGLPVLMLVFSILAFRGIRKDDNRVKSYDRLR